MKEDTKKKVALIAIVAFGFYLWHEHKKKSNVADLPGAMIPDQSGGAQFTDNGLMAPGNTLAPLYIDKKNISINQSDFIIRYKLGNVPNTI